MIFAVVVVHGSRSRRSGEMPARHWAQLIAYGLGNFAFEIDGDPNTAILKVWLDEGGVRQLEYVPAVISAALSWLSLPS